MRRRVCVSSSKKSKVVSLVVLLKIPKFPTDVIILSLPLPSLILISPPPVTLTSPLNVPVEPATVPPLMFPVKLPTKVVDVVTPVANIFPSLLKVIPLPTTIPFLAVIRPTESTFVTSS